MNVRFPAMAGFMRPTVCLFPQLFVCLDGGVAQFDVPDAELQPLADDDSGGQSTGLRYNDQELYQPVPLLTP